MWQQLTVKFWNLQEEITRKVVMGIMAAISQTTAISTTTWYGYEVISSYTERHIWLLCLPHHELNWLTVKLPFPHHILGWLAELGTAVLQGQQLTDKSGSQHKMQKCEIFSCVGNHTGKNKFYRCWQMFCISKSSINYKWISGPDDF